MRLSRSEFRYLRAGVRPLEKELLALIRSAVRKSAIAVDEKNTRKEAKELVSEVDFAADKILTRTLHRALNAPVASEERIAKWPPQVKQFWLVDPLDGTQNFLALLTSFGAMAVLIRDGSPDFVMCFLPAMRAYGLPMAVYAGRGRGAHWGSQRIFVSDRKDLWDAFLMVEGPSKATQRKNFIRRLTRYVTRYWINFSMVASGAAVAMGKRAPRGLDLLVSGGNGPWDNLPIDLLVHEAGGMVTDWEGNPPSLRNYANRIYTNGHLHDAVLAIARGEN